MAQTTETYIVVCPVCDKFKERVSHEGNMYRYAPTVTAEEEKKFRDEGAVKKAPRPCQTCR